MNYTVSKTGRYENPYLALCITLICVVAFVEDNLCKDYKQQAHKNIYTLVSCYQYRANISVTDGSVEGNVCSSMLWFSSLSSKPSKSTRPFFQFRSVY